MDEKDREYYINILNKVNNTDGNLCYITDDLVVMKKNYYNKQQNKIFNLKKANKLLIKELKEKE